MNNNTVELAFKLFSDSINVSEKKLAQAFNCPYHYWEMPKRNRRGTRLISEPLGELMEVQRALLNRFLYQLCKRKDYLQDPETFKKFYKKTAYAEDMKGVYKKYFTHIFDDRLTGLLPGTSYDQHAKTHAKESLFTLFVTTLDFKDAYPSVKKELIEKMLFEIFKEEIEYYKKAYLYGKEKRQLHKELMEYRTKCKELFEDLAQKDEIYNELKSWNAPYLKLSKKKLERLAAKNLFKNSEYWEQVIEMRDMFNEFNKPLRKAAAESLGKTVEYFSEIKLHAQTRWKDIYSMRFPLWGNRKNRYKSTWFRKLLRDEADGKIKQSEEIIKILAHQIAELVTDKGVLPQGAPTSGFFLCLAVSHSNILGRINATIPDRIPHSLSIFSDDITIATGNNPRKKSEGKMSLIEQWEAIINKSGIFTANTVKTRVFDRRTVSPLICGIRLNSTIAKSEKVFIRDPKSGKRIVGSERALRNDRPFRVSHVSIPKNRSKKIRAMFHQGVFAENDAEIHDLLSGYKGYIQQIYGDLDKWPNQLKKPFIRYQESRKA